MEVMDSPSSKRLAVRDMGRVDSIRQSQHGRLLRAMNLKWRRNVRLDPVLG